MKCITSILEWFHLSVFSLCFCLSISAHRVSRSDPARLVWRKFKCTNVALFTFSYEERLLGHSTFSNSKSSVTFCGVSLLQLFPWRAQGSALQTSFDWWRSAVSAGKMILYWKPNETATNTAFVSKIIHWTF